MLDVSVRSGILRLLLQLRDELGVAFLFVSHDLSVARYVSDRIAVMYLGRIVELGPTDRVVHSPVHPYTRMLIAAVPEADPTRVRKRQHRRGEAATVQDIPSGCRFRTRCPEARPGCAEVEPELLSLEEDHLVACHFRAALANATVR
jgi:oligopeptide/dipeptide ABC transporter ATP-binding protein